MTDREDASLQAAMDREVMALVPHWSDPQADAIWYARIVSVGERRPGRWGQIRVLSVRTVAVAAVVGLFFGLGHYFSSRGTGDSPLLATLTADTALILNQAVSAKTVSLSEPTANTAELTNLGGGHWKTILYRMAGDRWVPVSLTSQVAGLTLTYQVATGPLTPGVLLTAAEMVEVERHLQALPYNPTKDSQPGALARLPLNVARAVLHSPLNQAKVLMTMGHQEILALTYVTKGGSGQDIFLPVGWYWWKGAPAVMTEVIPSAQTTPSAEFSPPASPQKSSSP